jgi:hypothetical protein
VAVSDPVWRGLVGLSPSGGCYGIMRISQLTCAVPSAA